jgi:hypothetical protein
MFTRWSLRGRMLYQLWFGGVLAAGCLVGFFTESHAAIIGVVLGVAIMIAGLVTRSRIKARELERPAKLPD